MSEEKYYDPKKVTITKGNPETDFYLKGHVTGTPEYQFTAKVYDVGSKYGLDEGRISKLQVHHNGHRIIDYDREWLEKPPFFDFRDRLALRQIVKGFSTIPPKDWSAAAQASTQAIPAKDWNAKAATVDQNRGLPDRSRDRGPERD